MKKLCFLVLAVILTGQAYSQKGPNGATTPGNVPLAATYLSVELEAAHLLQLSADGNMTFIMSWQFDNEGIIGESYSNTKGNWKRSGPQTLTASTADIAFKGGKFIGVAHAHYKIEFEPGFQVARLTGSGAVYPPGVNPLDENAQPITGSEFNLTDPIRFERLRAE